MKNRAYHKGINRSPYEALFGCKMKVGLDTSFLPPYILKDLDDEESLLKLVDHNSIIPTNQDDENIITNDEDIITTINEDICTRTKKIENQRKEAHCNLELQAIKMKTRSNKKFPLALVGNTVRVPISDVDRGREAHNILACVLEVTEDGFYRLGNKTGTFCLIDNFVHF